MFQIVCDGGCDLSPAEAESLRVRIVPFYIVLDGRTQLREGVDITKEEYFGLLGGNKKLFPTTAQPSPQDYIDAYAPLLEGGMDIISLTISSKLSGTLGSASLAARLMEERFPDRKIAVVDSRSCAVGEGLVLKELAKMRDAGYSLERAASLLQDVIRSANLYFTLESLEYLRRGGRVGPAAALVGGILGLRPILHLADGAVEKLGSARGKKNALRLMEDGLARALRGMADDAALCVGHIRNGREADSLKARIELSLGTAIDSPVTEVGATIGTHAGPGALAVAYCRRFRSCEALRAAMPESNARMGARARSG